VPTRLLPACLTSHRASRRCPVSAAWMKILVEATEKTAVPPGVSLSLGVPEDIPALHVDYFSGRAGIREPVCVLTGGQ